MCIYIVSIFVYLYLCGMGSKMLHLIYAEVLNYLCVFQRLGFLSMFEAVIRHREQQMGMQMTKLIVSIYVLI